MTVKITRPSIDIRGTLDELNKPSGIAGNAMLAAETPQDQFNLIGAGRKNLIINGGFDVWQRGTSQTGSGRKSVDRWYGANPGAMAKDVDATGNPILKFTTNGHVDPYLFTVIEDGVRILRGKTVTFSCYIKSAHPDPIQFLYLRQYGTGGALVGKATMASSESGWDRYVFTTTIPESWTANDHLFTDIEFTGGMTADIWVKNVQLEIGSVATPFEHRSYGEELALCQRYYEIVWANNGGLDDSSVTGRGHNGGFLTSLKYQTTKRATPTIIAVGTLNNIWQGGITSLIGLGAVSRNGGVNSMRMYTASGSVPTGYACHQDLNAGSYIAAEAEL